MVIEHCVNTSLDSDQLQTVCTITPRAAHEVYVGLIIMAWLNIVNQCTSLQAVSIEWVHNVCILYISIILIMKYTYTAHGYVCTYMD